MVGRISTRVLVVVTLLLVRGANPLTNECAGQTTSGHTGIQPPMPAAPLPEGRLSLAELVGGPEGIVDQGSGAESPVPPPSTAWSESTNSGRVGLLQKCYDVHEGYGRISLAELQRIEGRRPFESDRRFDGFIGPISNAILSKDPRSVTEIRPLFIAGFTRPGTPVLGKSSYQVYALQARLALSDRFSLIADKDGIVVINPQGGKRITGLAKVAAGAKYVFIRDEENQFLFSGGLQVETPTGTDDVFEDRGSNLALFGTMGKEFGDGYHFLWTFGQNFRMGEQTSGYFYNSLHLDKQIGWFYPLFEANWYAYNQAGSRTPANLEGDGLLNLGSTFASNGKNIVSLAVGAKARLNERAWLGAAYEFGVSDDTDLVANRILVDLVLRY